MSDPSTISDAGRKLLLSSIDSRPFDGLITFNGTGTGSGLARSSWTRAMTNLQKAGLVEPYVHGGYEITEAGRSLRDDIVAADRSGLTP